MPASLPRTQSGPEALFRLGPLRPEGDLVHGSMPTGPWLAGPDGPPAAGSLGVLVDNVLGTAIFAGASSTGWSVSTEITVDLLEPLPENSTVHATGRVAHSDAISAFATGEVRDAEGGLLALSTQRGRYVAFQADLDGVDFERPAGDVADLLTLEERGFDLVIEVSDLLVNPMHNLHGGITLMLAETAARRALGGDAPPLATASLHVGYVRAVPEGALLELGTDVRYRGRTLAQVDVTGRVDGRVCTLSTVTFQGVGER